MIAPTLKERIDGYTENILDVAYTERKNSDQDIEAINEFLDTYNAFGSSLKERNEKLEYISNEIQRLTWIDEEFSESDLMSLNKLIAACRDAHYAILRTYISLNNVFRTKGMFKKEIKELKSLLDGFREDFTTLEEVYFYYPKNKDIQDIINQFSNME